MMRKGELLQIHVGDGGTPEVFLHLGSAVLVGLRLRNMFQDASHACSGAWRLLAGQAAQQSLRVEVEGQFASMAAEEALRARAFAGSSGQYKLLLPNGDVVSGVFAVVEYGRSGDVLKAEAFSLQLESAGAVNFVKAV